MQQLRQPPILRGTEREQLVQMRQYLYQISRDLNVALTNLTAENFAADSEVAKIASGQLSEKQKAQIESGMGNLKGLIIKTAKTVNAEIDAIEATLESSYVAKSDYGTFTENITTKLTAMADSIKQTIDYQAEFEQFKIDTTGYIKQGIIGYENAVPIIGIAIGQNIQTTGTDVVEGKEYDIIDVTSNVSVWTSEKLSFYVNGMESAYVSGGAFYVTKTLILGNRWAIAFDNGFSIRWIGG